MQSDTGSKPVVPAPQRPPLAPTQPIPAAAKVEAAPAPKRTKKRKAPDRQLPHKVAQIVPESSLFNKLLEYERRIDNVLKRKKTDIQEALAEPDHCKKRLRVYVYNTHSNQAGDPVDPVAQPPGWRLYVYGRLLDPANAAANGATTTGVAPLTPTPPHAAGHQAFSSFLKSLSVKLDEAKYPGDHVTWEKSKHNAEHKDSFEFCRQGSEPVDVEISLDLDWQPARYQLPNGLADLLKLQYDSRARVLQSLWLYIQANKLQDKSDPAKLNLDDHLASVFGEKGIALSSIGARLNNILAPMPPVMISYTVQVNGQTPTHPECYDIEFDIPVHRQSERLTSILDTVSKDREVDMFDAKVSQSVVKINEHRRRRAFFLGFSQSPLNFINTLVASQAMDLRIAKSANGKDFEMRRRSDVFYEKWVEDAAMKYLHRKVAAGH